MLQNRRYQWWPTKSYSSEQKGREQQAARRTNKLLRKEATSKAAAQQDRTDTREGVARRYGGIGYSDDEVLGGILKEIDAIEATGEQLPGEILRTFLNRVEEQGSEELRTRVAKLVETHSYQSISETGANALAEAKAALGRDGSPEPSNSWEQLPPTGDGIEIWRRRTNAAKTFRTTTPDGPEWATVLKRETYRAENNELIAEENTSELGSRELHRPLPGGEPVDIYTVLHCRPLQPSADKKKARFQDDVLPNYKMGGSKYKTRDWAKANKTDDMYTATLKEIAEKDSAISEEIDPSSPEWAERVTKTYREQTHCQLPEELREDLIRTVIKPHAAQFYEIGCPFPVIKGVKASFTAKSSAKWKLLTPYPMSFLDKIRMDYLIREQVREGKLIEVDPQKTGLPIHASPAFLADSKGHLARRMVVDYREFNDQCKNQVYRMPDAVKIQNSLTRGNPKYFVSADLAMGYNQADLEEETRRYLAIITECGVYLPTKLPLGPKWAPAWFQSQTDLAFSHLRDSLGVEFCNVFIGDLCFSAADYPQLKERL